jgi:hypothetical protein
MQLQVVRGLIKPQVSHCTTAMKALQLLFVLGLSLSNVLATDCCWSCDGVRKGCEVHGRITLDQCNAQCDNPCEVLCL